MNSSILFLRTIKINVIMKLSIQINNEEDFNTCIDLLHSMDYYWHVEPQEYLPEIKTICPHHKYISYSTLNSFNFVILASEFQQCAQYLLLQ